MQGLADSLLSNPYNLIKQTIMKTLRLKIVPLFFLMVGWTAMYGQQNQLEVPGDQFSLEGALELFKKSASPEEFERLLNSADAEVNNLDLNGDGDIDYIRVIDRNEGNVHAFILQAIISDNESQDVAVIELEKLANGKAVLQITGDADIYGIETIIEPTEEVRINAGTSTAQNVVNVWAWPSVQYVYGPYYNSWVSPWSWGYRPIWWNPWRPIAYVSYYSRWNSYRPYYAVCYTHRVHYAPQIYRPYRSTSLVVYNRHHTEITNYRSNHTAYSRGRDNDRGTAYNRGNDHARSENGDSRNNSRSSDYNRQQNNSGRKVQDRNEWNSRNKKSNSVADNEFKDRSSKNERSGMNSNSRDLKRDDSRNRSNQANSNPVTPRREAAPDVRGSQRSTPQVERNHSAGNSGGQRSMPQVERRQAPSNSGQRSLPQMERKSAGNSGGQRSGSSTSGGSRAAHKRGN